MVSIATWVASAATMIAAMMTAANLGTRVTGWGFAVFVIGSVSWTLVGIASGQTGLAVTNGFLLLVNAFGVWRWLRRQARYEDGGDDATRKSRSEAGPVLYPATSIIGARVLNRAGDVYGTVVDAMIDADAKRLAYAIVSDGGIAGAGETLKAIADGDLTLGDKQFVCALSPVEWQALPDVGTKDWPTAPAPPRAGSTRDLKTERA